MPNWMRETSFKRKHLLVSEYLPEMSRGCTTRKKHNIAPESHEFLFYSSRDNTKLEKYLKIFYVYLQLCTFPGHREATEEPIPAILCDWLQHTERLLLSFPSEFMYSVLVPAQSFYLYLQPCPLLCFPTLFLLFSHKMSSVQFSLKKEEKPTDPSPHPPSQISERKSQGNGFLCSFNIKTPKLRAER